MARRKPETLIQTGIRLFMQLPTIAEAEQLLEIGTAVVKGRRGAPAPKPRRVRATPPAEPPAGDTVTITAPSSAVTASTRRRRTAAEKRQAADQAAGVIAPKRGRGRPRLVQSITTPAPETMEAAPVVGTPLESIPQLVDE